VFIAHPSERGALPERASDQFKGMRTVSWFTMEQKLSPRTNKIPNLYMQGHSPARIGHIIRLEEGRVLFTLYQFGALSPEDSEVWAERLRHAREAPTQAT